jgi:succinate dehydrogenase flavin-adding protein (antitoxin of CptAB toxin-antitoxin module)
MTKFETILEAAKDLSAEELAKLRAFLDELDADLWDAQIERDAKAGKLDKIEARALENLKAGRVRDL